MAYNGWNTRNTWCANIHGLGEINSYEKEGISKKVYESLEDDYTEQDIKDAINTELMYLARTYESNYADDFNRAVSEVPDPYRDMIDTPDIDWIELLTTCNDDEIFDMVNELIEANKEDEDDEENE